GLGPDGRPRWHRGASRRSRRARAARHRRPGADAVRSQPRAREDADQREDRGRDPSRLLRQREPLTMAVTKVVMPKLSEQMESGKIIKWLKKEGDRVQSGDILAEVETDKADVEMEALRDGALRKSLGA